MPEIERSMTRRPGAMQATIAIAVLVGVLLGLPAVAWAASAGYQFDATRLGNQRLPADSGGDFRSPPVTNGRVISDLDGTACDSTYGVQLVRQRTALPDEVVHRHDGRACDGPTSRSGLHWGEGRYHFDARVVARQESNFGRGHVRAEW